MCLCSKLEPHKNVLQVHGMALRDGQPLMVLAFMPLGSLDMLLKKRALTPQETKSVLKGVMHGLAHLARASIVHRDVAARNVLVCLVVISFIIAVDFDSNRTALFFIAA